MTASEVDLLIVIALIAAAVAVWAAVVSVNAAAQARRNEQATVRERDHLNRTWNYQHPRSTR